MEYKECSEKGLTAKEAIEVMESVPKMETIAGEKPDTNKKSGGIEAVNTLPLFSFQKLMTGWISGLLFSSNAMKKDAVQVFTPINESTPKEFTEALSKMLTKMSFKCELMSSTTFQSDVPLLVVCPVVSRLGADINLALNGLNKPPTFVVLVLHCVNESCLPNTDTDQLLPDEYVTENIKFIDIAFTRDEKLYQCQMNSNAKEKIKSFIEKYYDKKKQNVLCN